MEEERGTWRGEQTPTEVGQRAGPIPRTSGGVPATVQMNLHVLAH